MRHRTFRNLFIAIIALLMPALALAKAPKKYQVTGKVLEVSADLIVVDKDGEKFEIERTAETKVDGDLKVGGKVTIHYTMSAASVEAKESKDTSKN